MPVAPSRPKTPDLLALTPGDFFQQGASEEPRAGKTLDEVAGVAVSRQIDYVPRVWASSEFGMG